MRPRDRNEVTRSFASAINIPDFRFPSSPQAPLLLRTHWSICLCLWTITTTVPSSRVKIAICQAVVSTVYQRRELKCPIAFCTSSPWPEWTACVQCFGFSALESGEIECRPHHWLYQELGNCWNWVVCCAALKVPKGYPGEGETTAESSSSIL